MTTKHLTAMHEGRARAAAKRREAGIKQVAAFRTWLRDESHAFQVRRSVEYLGRGDEQYKAAHSAWLSVLKHNPGLPPDSAWSDAG